MTDLPNPPGAAPTPPPMDAKTAKAAAAMAKAQAKALRPWYKKKRFLVGGALVVLIGLAMASGGGSKDSTTSSPDAPAATSPDSGGSAAAKGASPTTTAPKSAAPKTIFTQSGSGQGTTPNFTVPDEWQLRYRYDCSNFGTSGNFMVTVNGVGHGNSGMDFSAPTVNELGAGKSNTAYAHNDPGVKNLEILSECDWTVTVVG